MPGPRVAVIGAGAWGTTLAAIVAKREPVLLLCHRPEVVEEISRTHRNERRLPGVDLPEYKHTLIERFSNPQVRDTITRLCA